MSVQGITAPSYLQNHIPAIDQDTHPSRPSNQIATEQKRVTFFGSIAGHQVGDNVSQYKYYHQRSNTGDNDASFWYSSRWSCFILRPSCPSFPSLPHMFFVLFCFLSIFLTSGISRSLFARTWKLERKKSPSHISYILIISHPSGLQNLKHLFQRPALRRPRLRV